MRSQAATDILFTSVTAKNVDELQKLNSVLFPVQYNEKFYEKAVQAPEGFARLGTDEMSRGRERFETAIFKTTKGLGDNVIWLFISFGRHVQLTIRTS